MIRYKLKEPAGGEAVIAMVHDSRGFRVRVTYTGPDVLKMTAALKAAATNPPSGDYYPGAESAALAGIQRRFPGGIAEWPDRREPEEPPSEEIVY